MISLSLKAVANGIGAELHGPDLTFTGCSTDTRTLREGELFVALHGPNFDGHEFVDSAEKSGAVAAIVDRPVETGLPLLQVRDTQRALGELAALWRDKFQIPVVAITGSNGKTTVKEMLSSILSCGGNVLATKGNFNNEIGVPQTLFNLDQKHDFAVIEMGANRPNDIARLCEIAKPEIGLVTLCAPAHLEGFGSIEGVADAKGEIFEALGHEGTAIINADDKFASLWRKKAGASRVITFGMMDTASPCPADITAAIAAINMVGSHIRLHIPGEEIDVRLPLPGRHNIMNALAATACAVAIGIDAEKIRYGLEQVEVVPGRLQFKRVGKKLIVIDDTYNANPGSFTVALDVLISSSGEQWLVLGDMGELGSSAIRLHREAGQRACFAGIDRFFTIGRLSRHAAEAFGPDAEHFTDLETLIDRITTLKKASDKDITLLIKGSRAAQMERVVQALESEYASDPC